MTKNVFTVTVRIYQIRLREVKNSIKISRIGKFTVLNTSNHSMHPVKQNSEEDSRF